MGESPKIALRGSRQAGNGSAKSKARAKQSGADRLPVAKTYKIYIGGKFPRTESGRYYALEEATGEVIANVCRSSRKDFREAVVSARQAFGSWSQSSAFLRGQILYRIAEMLEGRREQFIAELVLQGVSKRRAQTEVTTSIDRLVYYAGWADKYQQVFSAINPVSSSHLNFTVLEPMGVIAILAPESEALLGLVSNIAPAIAGGNTCVTLSSESRPLCAVSFAEVLHASDVPPGVVNLMTGFREELATQFASHMDVNAVVYCDADGDIGKTVEYEAAHNIKRVVARTSVKWGTASAQDPYFIRDTQEIKTTWHPIGT